MKEAGDLDYRTQALRKLLAASRTLLLSTASPEGAPDLSYAPFVRDQQGRFYIFISQLARHTLNLQANPQASVMFIRAEEQSPNLFARERAVFQCRADIIGREQSDYESQLTLFRAQFGEVIGLLQSLPDFHLFRLTPEEGRYVAGFGQAFSINIENNSLNTILKS